MNMENETDDEDDESDEGTVAPVTRNKKRKQLGKQATSGGKQVRRPKGAAAVATGTTSVLYFFKKA